MARVRKALAWSNKAPTSALPAILRPLDREGDGNAPIDFTDISDQSLKLVSSVSRSASTCYTNHQSDLDTKYRADARDSRRFS